MQLHEESLMWTKNGSNSYSQTNNFFRQQPQCFSQSINSSYKPWLDLPTFVAFATSDIGCHGFIGTPGLHLVIGILALATPAALEHVSGGLFFLIGIMHTSFQAFQLYLNVLTLPLVTGHLLCTHGYKSLRLDLSKKHLPP